MGFLTDAAKGNETNIDMGAMREEMYKHLFPKMGRDFVSREDFFLVIEQLLDIVDPARTSAIDFRKNTEARQLARTYKENIDSGQGGNTNLYDDLIDLDES